MVEDMVELYLNIRIYSKRTNILKNNKKIGTPAKGVPITFIAF